MRVVMLTNMTRPAWLDKAVATGLVIRAGDMVDLPDARAQALIDRKLAAPLPHIEPPAAEPAPEAAHG